jgi:leucine-zipper-like transcriptional regulator 1
MQFTDVKRKLEVFSPLPTDDFTIHDRSPTLGEEPCPPCLRFPTGAIIGTHLLIAGTHLSPTTQTFAVWSLNLLSLTWTQIDTGNDVAASAWFQGCLWRDANKFLMFGNRTGNNVNDFSHRLSSWDRIAVIDLEAFGIYQPPKLEFDFDMQELSLTALEERVGSDYEIVCDDGRKIKCSRKLLEDRWPWFQAQLSRLLENAKLAMGIAASSPPPQTPTKDMRPDPRVTSRAFDLSEPYPVTMALMQYFYTLSLLTPLQQAPAVLSQLLVLSTNYQIPRLQSLVKHAMHLALSESTCVGVYEVATLCGCRSLQIRYVVPWPDLAFCALVLIWGPL